MDKLEICETCGGIGEVGHFEGGAAPGWVNEPCPENCQYTFSELVLRACKDIDQIRGIDNNTNPRNPLYSFLHATEEIGELGKEMNIKFLGMPKEPSVDGVLGEAIDAIICLMDVIYTTYPGITDKDIKEYAATKLDKWRKIERKVSIAKFLMTHKPDHPNHGLVTTA